jgi:hypothetical protein
MFFFYIKPPGGRINIPRRAGLASILCALIISGLFAGACPAAEDGYLSVPCLTVPAEYGRVVYQYDGENPSQVYIIAVSHRNLLENRTAENTAAVQAEAYMLGKWLVENEHPGLLLPEGFFRADRGRSAGTGKAAAPGRTGGRDDSPEGMDALRAVLSGDAAYANAETLLKYRFGLVMGQVEEKGLYEAVRKQLAGLREAANVYEGFYLRAGLEYLQQRRTAAMLQRIPDVIRQERDRGGIKNRKAIFTIGLNHIKEIIDFLELGAISVPAPLFSDTEWGDYSSGLRLLEEGYGVTIIIPRTLVEDRTLLAMTGLDRVLPR